MEEVLVALRHMQHENQSFRESIAHLQGNQTLTRFGNTLKEPWIHLPKKFDGTCSKFWGFINQICLIIQFHSQCYPNDRTQVTHWHLIIKHNFNMVWTSFGMSISSFKRLWSISWRIWCFLVIQIKMYNNKQVTNSLPRSTTSFCVHLWIQATSMWPFMGWSCVHAPMSVWIPWKCEGPFIDHA